MLQLTAYNEHYCGCLITLINDYALPICRLKVFVPNLEIWRSELFAVELFILVVLSPNAFCLVCEVLLKARRLSFEKEIAFWHILT